MQSPQKHLQGFLGEWFCGLSELNQQLAVVKSNGG